MSKLVFLWLITACPKTRAAVCKDTGIFSQKKLKKEELPEVEQGTPTSLWVRGSAPVGTSHGQHMRICLPGKEGKLRGGEGLCPSIPALRSGNPHPLRGQGTLCPPGEPAAAQSSSPGTRSCLASGLSWLEKSCFSTGFVTQGVQGDLFRRGAGLLVGCYQTENEAKKRSGGTCRERTDEQPPAPRPVRGGTGSVWKRPREEQPGLAQAPAPLPFKPRAAITGIQ